MRFRNSRFERLTHKAPGLAGGYLLTAAVFGTALIAGAVPTLVKSSDRRREYASVLSLVTGVTVCATAIYVTFVKHDEPNQPLIGYQLTDSTLDLPDPSLTGPRDVLHTTYGSGNDRHRPEFGVEAGFVSEAVDGSKLIDNWKGAVGWTRTGYWGFGVDELPVQGRVWYPDGEGPYPLVLIVHGNHSMEDFSDGGYEYLGRLAASRGYIFVSVDENFLNSSLGDLVNPIKPRLEEENDARAWLLLEHLRQWRTWQQTPEHPFDGLVDMSNITLIGHSRGGEAVAIAAHFNRLGHYPDDATLTFDYNFAIKGVVAIAPVDGQYKPRDVGTPMQNVSYFTIHGSMDGDVSSFMGLTQYSRAKLDRSDQFKASLYVHPGNHGQFNTSWGDEDTVLGWGLRKSVIMPPETQRQILSVYVSAFLDALHQDKREYLPIFESARYAAAWLPDGYYINNFQKASTLWLMNFDEDGDPATATHHAGTIHGTDLTKWFESWVNLKARPLESQVLQLAWDDRVNQQPASLNLHLANALDFTSFSALVFSATQSQVSSLPKGFEPDKDASEQDGEQDEGQKDKSPIDWTLQLTDGNGLTASTQLSTVEPLYPQVVEDTRLAQFGYMGSRSEAIMKYYAFPFSSFTPESDAFDRERITAVSFLFDRSKRGSVYIDDVGLARPDDR